MRLLEPLAVDASAPLARAHPLAKIASAFVVMLALFVTVDVVTSAVLLAAILAALAASGVPLGAFARRTLPLAVTALAVAAFNTAFGRDHSVLNGVAVGLRLIGIALAGVVAVATIDPTDLADALVEHTPAPPRFVVGALAAFRLFPLFSREWETLGLARRARGIEADRSLVDRVRAFPERSLGLLIAAIRRATRLALAMDARGFGSMPCRTLARPRPITLGDRALVAASALLAIAATAVSVSLGTWRPIIAF